MSKSVSLSIEDELSHEVDEAAELLHVARDTFIVQAIRRYARQISRSKLRAQLRRESALVADGSLAVLHEFEELS
jgi:predicted transcriptional regulator